ncbi:MAG: DUF4281 domain-containing protein [Pyrinomonadaceae bacterium]|nr:DUF4281 domain-containing protein [Pyrinomonadaceae bacterium]
MNAEAIFSACNALALVGWLLLILLPRWTWTMRLVLSGIIPLLLAAVYLVLIILYFGRAEGGFGSLAEVAQLFRQPFLLLAGWIHYLAFDLFVGGWETRDAQRLKVPHLVVVPCLVLTFLLGPIGLIAYYVVRLRWQKNLNNSDLDQAGE